MSARTVYLDHAATTPLDDRVLEVMMPYLTSAFGNASSVHALGRKARFVVEESRERVAALLGAEPSEIVFVSGGTEADNTAILGTLNDRRPHLVTSAAEHEAVLRPAERRMDDGRPTTILDPRAHGAVEAEQVRDALTAETGLVSIMHVNNELGTVTPIREVADVCRAHGVPFHCDAVQSAGSFRLDVDELGVDLLSLSGHKFYGPKGVGVLYVRGGTDVAPLIRGGAQERGRRGGTENVAAIVGLAHALHLAHDEASARLSHLEGLQRRFCRSLTDVLGDQVLFNTPVDADGVDVAPHIVSVSFPPQDGRPLDGEMLLLGLDMEGICASAGSACTSGALEPSHVLRAVGREPATAAATVRFSMGKDTTAQDVNYTVDRLARIVRRMRA